MENNSNVVIGKEATMGLMNGISKATQAIRVTYGYRGMNASVENVFYPFVEVANDCQTIIQAIQVTDAVQKVGLNFLKELSDKQDATSGDGRKTAFLMAEE